jgi:hypothetical protein
MTRIRLILTAAALAFVATSTLSPTAAADNCDIFINPEDCQNTGWTIGTIATLTGGVAVAVAATLTGTRTPGPGNHAPAPPPPPPPAPQPPPPLPPPPLAPWNLPTRVPRGDRSSDDRDDDSTIEGVEVRPTIDAPVVTVQPDGEHVHAHSVRLEVHLDQGTQTVQEVYRDSH